MKTFTNYIVGEDLNEQFDDLFGQSEELEEAYQQFTDKTANWGEGQAVAFGRKKGYKEVAVMNDNNSKHPMVLFALNSSDKQYIKGSNVKPGETVFRYATKISIAGDIFPLVKVNIAKGIFYNLTQESSEGTIEDAKFETRGVKLKFFRSLEGAIKESVDLQEMKAGDVKKKLDKVKGLSKSAYDQIVTLPMPVLTTMVNQLSTLVASYNEETELAESGHDDVASMKTKVKVAMMAIQKMNQELSKLPDDGDLPTWWTNKVAIAVDKLDGMADYLDTKVENVDLGEMKMPKGYTDNDFVHIAKARVGSFVNPKTDKIIGFSKSPKNPNKAPTPKSGANSVMRIGEAKKKKFKIEGYQLDESLARDLKKAEDAMGGSKTKEQGIQFVMDTMKVNKRKATQLVDKILKMKGSQRGKVTFKESESIDEAIDLTADDFSRDLGLHYDDSVGYKLNPMGVEVVSDPKGNDRKYSVQLKGKKANFKKAAEFLKTHVDADKVTLRGNTVIFEGTRALGRGMSNIEETALEEKYPKAARGKASVGYPHAPRGMRWKTLIPMRGKTTIVNYRQAVKDYGKDNVHYTKGGMKSGEDHVQVLLPESTHHEATRALGRGMSNVDRNVNVETAAKILDAVKSDDLISSTVYDNLNIVKDVAQEANDLASGVKDGPSDEGLKKTAGMIAKDLNRFAKMAEKELAIMEKSSKRFEAAVRSAGGMIGKRKNLLKFREEAEIEGDVELIEGMKMNDPKLIKMFDGLKRNDVIKLKIDSSISKGKELQNYVVKSKTKVRRGEVDKVTLILQGNPTGVKRFMYKKDGKVTFAIGDMAASIADIKEAVDPADVDQYVATKGDKESAKMNIIVQLRKAADVKGNLDIVFQDGKKKRVPMNIITIALNKFNSFKRPANKEKLVKAMGKSYKDMLVALKTIKEYSKY